MPRPRPADDLENHSVRLPKTLWADLQHYCRTADAQASQVIRRALREHLTRLGVQLTSSEPQQS